MNQKELNELQKSLAKKAGGHVVHMHITVAVFPDGTSKVLSHSTWEDKKKKVAKKKTVQKVFKVEKTGEVLL